MRLSAYQKLPNLNNLWAQLMINELIRLGVTYLGVAPGSRNSPLTLALSRQKSIEPVVHFDERALAFHALGHCSATRKPTVILCTSGTAGANFYPAVIEASKKKLPLIIITADRPPELRQTGAMQTIHQPGLFGRYVKWSLDMPVPTPEIPLTYVLTTMDQAVYQAQSKMAGPVHLNCMYRDPLDLNQDQVNCSKLFEPIKNWMDQTEPFTRYVKTDVTLSGGVMEELVERLERIKKGVIVVGKLSSVYDADSVHALAQVLGWPIFPDVTSRLRLGRKDEHIVSYYDQLLGSANIQSALKVDGILHLGGRITSKRYYQWVARQNLKEYMMVLNHPLRNDPQHQVTFRLDGEVNAIARTLILLMEKRNQPKYVKDLAQANQKVHIHLDKALAELSEPAVHRTISQSITKGDGLFLSNSMPVRDMDMFADPSGSSVEVGGNRGASGIDGILASACGFARGIQRSTTVVVGDLAALHDLNSFSLVEQSKQKMIIVIINNDGGGIFSFLDISKNNSAFDSMWGTPHGYDFKSAAKQFSLNYSQAKTLTAFQEAYQKAQASKHSCVIEVQTQRSSNAVLHQQLLKQVDALFKGVKTS